MKPRDYGPFPYVPIRDRPKLEWPGGARLAIWVTPNIEFFPLTRGIAGQPGAPPGNPPSVRAWAQRDYGNRVGIWRLMDVLSKHGIRASPTLNSDICDHHPQIVRAAIELGWEILGHNRTKFGGRQRACRSAVTSERPVAFDLRAVGLGQSRRECRSRSSSVSISGDRRRWHALLRS
jgi:hypothetical protein